MDAWELTFEDWPAEALQSTGTGDLSQPEYDPSMPPFDPPCTYNGRKRGRKSTLDPVDEASLPELNRDPVAKGIRVEEGGVPWDKAYRRAYNRANYKKNCLRVKLRGLMLKHERGAHADKPKVGCPKCDYM